MKEMSKEELEHLNDKNDCEYDICGLCLRHTAGKDLHETCQYIDRQQECPDYHCGDLRPRGTRVGVYFPPFSSSSRGKLTFIGWGIYLGNVFCPALTEKMSLIRLDCGETVWGIECYWSVEEDMKKILETTRAANIPIIELEPDEIRPFLEEEPLDDEEFSVSEWISEGIRPLEERMSRTMCRCVADRTPEFVRRAKCTKCRHVSICAGCASPFPDCETCKKTLKEMESCECVEDSVF